MRNRILGLGLALALAPLPAAAQDQEPGYWEIVGVGGAIRSSPLAGGGVVDRPEAGTVVRNLGCERSAGREWCEVERLDGPEARGWVGRTNLKAAEAPEG